MKKKKKKNKKKQTYCFILLKGEDRAHRIGREGSVDVKYLYADGTIGKLYLHILTCFFFFIFNFENKF